MRRRLRLKRVANRPEKRLIGKKITVICGISGAGKTRARMQNPVWKTLPQLDTATYYDEKGAEGWEQCFQMLIEDALKLLQKEDHIVVEGYFRPDGPQRAWMEYYQSEHGFDVEYVWLTAKKTVLMARLEKEFGEKIEKASPEEQEFLIKKFHGRVKGIELYGED